MDALFFVARNQFQELATHISLNHQDNSPGYKVMAENVLRAVKLKPERFILWNVPNMSEHTAGSIPVDIHGKYVLVDELHAMQQATSYGMLRYAYYICAIRAATGGRWRYDFTTMNSALAVAGMAGCGMMALFRRRMLLKWSCRHPLATLSLCWFTAFGTVVLTRAMLRTFGLGILQTQRAHKRTLNCLGCVDCLGDVNEYTEHQIDELDKFDINTSLLPSLPEPLSSSSSSSSSMAVASSLPPEYKSKINKQLQIQKELLVLNIREVQNVRKRMDGKLCEVHTGLRSDPLHYCEPNGLELLQSDRERAQRRVKEANNDDNSVNHDNSSESVNNNGNST